jgi:hypothetical protein
MICKSFSTKALQVLRPSNCRVQASCVHLAPGPLKAGELAGGSVHASDGKSTGAGTGLGVLKRMLFHSVSTYSTESHVVFIGSLNVFKLGSFKFIHSYIFVPSCTCQQCCDTLSSKSLQISELLNSKSSGSSSKTKASTKGLLTS